MATFDYKNNRNPEQVFDFKCKLQSKRCIGVSKNKKDPTKKGVQCKRKVVNGLPFCWYHLKSASHLTIKPSGIAGAGTGLFACDPTKDDDSDDVVFKMGDLIVPYVGEHVSSDTIDDRYGDADYTTAPYAVTKRDGHIIDSACLRGAGAIANDARGAANNAKIVAKKINTTIANRLNASRATGHLLRPNTNVLSLIATKPIKQGKEVFANYGADYWEHWDEHTDHKTSGKAPNRKCKPATRKRR